MLMPGITYAQSNIVSLKADEFYMDCLDSPPALGSFQNIRYFCSCASARFQENMNETDVLSLQFPETNAGQKTQRRILQSVYTPCLTDPLHDLLFEECMASQYLDNLKSLNKRGYCACENVRLPLLFQETASSIMLEETRKKDAELNNPVEIYLTHKRFTKKAASIARICFDQNITKSEKKRHPLERQVLPLLTRPERDNTYNQ